MSVICGEGDHATACENDIAINFMKELFGKDFIEAFYIAGTDHPAIVDSSDTILSLIASNLAGAALITAFIILIFNIWKGIGSAANDGGAASFSSKSSMLGMYGRPLFSLVMLAPTLSGFPVVFLAIVLIALTANGLTNEGFDSYISRDYNPQTMVARLDNPNYISANDLVRPAFYGALHGYCVKLANEEFSSDMKMTRSDTFLNPQTLAVINTIPLVSIKPPYNHNYSIQYEDTSGWSILGFGLGKSGIVGDACGSFSAKVPAQPKLLPIISSDPELTRVSNQLVNDVRGIGTKIASYRAEAAQIAYFDAFQAANGKLPVMSDDPDYKLTPAYFCNNSTFAPCTNFNNNGWQTDPEQYNDTNKPNVDIIIAIAKARSGQLNEVIAKEVLLDSGYTIYEAGATSPTLPTANANEFANRIEAIKSITLSQGWMAAGTYRTRFQKFRTSLQNALYTKPYSVTFSNVQDDGDTEKLTNFLAHMNVVRESLFAQASDSQYLNSYSDLKIESSVASINIKNRDAGGMMDKLAYGVTQSLFDAEKEMIESITGTGIDDGVDSLTRIQGVGESIAGISLVLTGIHKVISVGFAALQMTIGSVGAGAADYVYDSSNAIEAARNLYFDTLGGWLIESIDSLFDISRIFAVVIPTMPYVFLALAAVGWIMQIIQTCFGMPLFFIMHSIPEKSFVGSQAQGYITLISLAFRPIIILAAFFLSFAIYDPVLTYVSQAYFSLHGEIAGSSSDSSLASLLIVLSTFKYYWFVYGGIVMLVTYLVFGLVQELGDSVLNWLGTNLLSGFGNMETEGVMKGAAGGMAAHAFKAKQIKQQRHQQQQSPSNNTNFAPAPAPAGAPAGGGGGGGLGANQPASLANGSRRSMGSSGPAPTQGQDSYSQRSGQLGATALVTAGSAVTGAVRGARDQGKASFANTKNASGGGVKGAIGGTVAGAKGAIVGGVKGAGHGMARGSKAFFGRNAYQNNLQKANSRGDIGTKGYSKIKSNTAKMNANAQGARNGGAPLTAKGFGRRTGVGKMAYGVAPSQNAMFRQITPIRSTSENSASTTKPSRAKVASMFK